MFWKNFVVTTVLVILLAACGVGIPSNNPNCDCVNVGTTCIQICQEDGSLPVSPMAPIIDYATPIDSDPEVLTLPSPIPTAMDVGTPILSTPNVFLGTPEGNQAEIYIMDGNLNDINAIADLPQNLGNFPGAYNLNQFFNEYGLAGKAVQLIHSDGTLTPIGVLYFHELAGTDQANTANKLIQACMADGYECNIEVGFGIQPFSVFDAAGNTSNRIVLGFDPSFMPYNFHRDILLPVNYPTSGSNSAGVVFNVNAWSLLEGSVPYSKADMAYSIAPFNNLTIDTAILTARLAENGYTVPAANYGFINQEALQSAVTTVDPTVHVEVLNMSHAQIRTLLGTNYSLFLQPMSGENQMYQVIHSWMK